MESMVPQALPKEIFGGLYPQYMLLFLVPTVYHASWGFQAGSALYIARVVRQINLPNVEP